MYYINHEQIQIRLDAIPYLAQAAEQLLAEWSEASKVHQLAQERILHLAIEIVTDVGSYIIDGFLMRDASSYEDIIDIISGEQVIPADMAECLKEWVAWRRPLVQQYFELARDEQLRMLESIPQQLPLFAEQVKDYIRTHMI